MCDENCAVCTKYKCELREIVFDTKAPWSRDKTSEKRKGLRRYHLSKGLCADCGKHPIVPGITLCQECREKRLIRDRKRRERENAKA